MGSETPLVKRSAGRVLGSDGSGAILFVDAAAFLDTYPRAEISNVPASMSILLQIQLQEGAASISLVCSLFERTHRNPRPVLVVRKAFPTKLLQFSRGSTK